MKKLFTLAFIVLFVSSGFAQIWSEDFEGDAINDGLNYAAIGPGVIYPVNPSSGNWSTDYGYLVPKGSLIFSVQTSSGGGQNFEIQNIEKSGPTGSATFSTDTFSIDVAINKLQASLILSWESGISLIDDYFQVEFVMDGSVVQTITRTGTDFSGIAGVDTIKSNVFESGTNMFMRITALNNTNSSMFMDSILVVEIIDEVVLTDIYDIQYTTIPGEDGTYPSPLLGQEVTIEGTVTGSNIGGYYVQQEDGHDGDNVLPVDNSAWTGIYVANTLITPSAGDIVRVTGTIVENQGKTEILSTGVNAAIVGSGDAIIPNMIYSLIEEKYESVLITARFYRVVFSDVDELVYPNVGSIIGIGEGATHAYEILVDRDMDEMIIFPVNKTRLFDRIYGIGNYYSNTFRISPRDAADYPATNVPVPTVDVNLMQNRVSSISNNIILESSNIAQASIYNLAGQMVNTLNVQEGRTEVNMEAGIYIVKLNTGNKVITEKVLVK